MTTREQRDKAVRMVSAVLNAAAVANGSIIRAGWLVARVGMYKDIPDGDPRLEMLREAYMGGAQHLFVTMLSVFEEGSEPTNNDMAVMESISDELDQWYKHMAVKYNL